MDAVLFLVVRKGGEDSWLTTIMYPTCIAVVAFSLSLSSSWTSGWMDGWMDGVSYGVIAVCTWCHLSPLFFFFFIDMHQSRLASSSPCSSLLSFLPSFLACSSFFLEASLSLLLLVFF